MLTASVCLGMWLSAAPTAVAGQAVATTKPASTPAIDWAKHYYDRVAQFKRDNDALPKPDGRSLRIVLVGSSHFERFNEKKLLPGREVINRGIASDRIGVDERGILHRLNCSVFDCKPGFIFLENGVNDLGELWRHGTPSIDVVDACYRKVVM